MIAEIHDNQHVYLTHITDTEDQMVWVEFSVSKPNRYIDPTQLGNWDGIFRKYNRLKKRFARPLLQFLEKACEKHNVPLRIVDKRDAWGYEVIDTDLIDEDFLPGIKLEDYQINAIKQACINECGIVDVPTGGGKTEVISGICKAVKCPTVILADQTVIIDQIKQRLELRDVVEEVGLFYAGKKPDGQIIVVGSIQSISPPTKFPEMPIQKHNETDKAYSKRYDAWDKKVQAFKTRKKNAKILQKYVHDAEMLIVDEADKATSEQWKALFRYHFKGRRRYGVTGTPFDKSKPVEALVLQEHLGSVIAKETRARLTELGRIIPCEYFMLAYGLNGNIHESTAYDEAYDEHITNSVKYSNIIKNLCKKYCVNDDGTLIIVDREALGLRLKETLLLAGIKAEFIYGKTPQKQRDAALRSFERRALQVLIGGKIINRGLDLAGGCETLIIASGGKLQSEFLQKIGRALRRNKYGKSRIFDFYFRCNKYLYQHSKARMQTIIEAGYPVKIVLPGGLMDGTELIRSRWKIASRYLNKG